MTASGIQRGKVRVRLSLRQPIDKSSEPELENRALFAKDAERQAAVEKQRKRVQRELRKRRKR